MDDVIVRGPMGGNGDAAGAVERPTGASLVRSPLPIDLRLTVGPLSRMAGPTARWLRDGSWWRATRTPDGPATVRYAPANGGIAVHSWGPGASFALESAPDLLGVGDSLDGFDPPPGLVRDLHRRMRGLRITRSRAVFEAIVPTVLTQKVTGKEAARSWRALSRALGEPAPGPLHLLLPPSPDAVAGLPYHALHPFGVEMRRANVIRLLAREAAGGRLDRLPDVAPAVARRRLEALPGVGVWTAAEVAIVALGDADAVSVGDYHIPNTVAWALAAEPRGTDERMLELLAPFAGHRGRVIRLFEAAGIAAPRFGPKATIRAIDRL